MQGEISVKKQSISIKKVAILAGATIHQYYGTAQYIDLCSSTCCIDYSIIRS